MRRGWSRGLIPGRYDDSVLVWLHGYGGLACMARNLCMGGCYSHLPTTKAQPLGSAIEV